MLNDCEERLRHRIRYVLLAWLSKNFLCIRSGYVSGYFVTPDKLSKKYTLPSILQRWNEEMANVEVLVPSFDSSIYNYNR